jgi:drug/metabolite transporter (DMT)-like permease
MSIAPAMGEATPRRVALPFAVCTIVWGSTWFVITTQLRFVPPIWSISWRFLFGALAMFAVAAAMRQPLRLPRAAHPLAILVGVPQFLLNYVFVYAAEGHMASGLVAIVSALLLVPNAVFGWMFLGHALSRRFLIGSGVAVAGLALLFAHELGQTGAGQWHTMMGVVLSILGVFSASVANVLQATKQAKALPPATLLAWSMAYGALADLALAFLTGGPPRLPLDPVYLAGLLYLAVIGSALTFSLYFGLIRRIGPGPAGYVGVLTPVMAMLLSTLFEGYRWTLTAAAGVALALAGLVVAVRARNPAR